MSAAAVAVPPAHHRDGRGPGQPCVSGLRHARPYRAADSVADGASVKILIVGGAGFLGAHVVRRCLAEPGHEVTVLDSLEPELHATTAHLQPVWDRIRFVRGSMDDE